MKYRFFISALKGFPFEIMQKKFLSLNRLISSFRLTWREIPNCPKLSEKKKLKVFI